MPPKRPTSQTAAAPTATAENIANIERMIAAQASVLAQKAPKQLQDMKTLLRELKAGKPPRAASEQMMRSLVIWQLDTKREDYSARLAARGSRLSRARLSQRRRVVHSKTFVCSTRRRRR